MSDDPVPDVEQLSHDIVRLRRTLTASSGAHALACGPEQRGRLATEASWCIEALRAFRAQLQAHEGVSAPR